MIDQRRLTEEDLEQAIQRLKENRELEDTGLYNLKMKNLQSMKEMVVNGRFSRNNTRREKRTFEPEAIPRIHDNI